jgi:hypothetical protein
LPPRAEGSKTWAFWYWFDTLGFVVGDGDPELFLQDHDQFDNVE